MSPKKQAARAASRAKPGPKTAARKPQRSAAAKGAAARSAAPGKAAAPKARAAKPRPAALMRARAVASLRFTRGVVDGLVKDFPEDKLTYQPAMTDNHVIWTLGHLAVTNHWFAGLLGGPRASLPPGYDELFGYRSKPNPDLAVYPPLAEVMQHYHATFNRLIRAADSLTDADLAVSCAEQSGGFARDKGEVLDRAVWHEGWHGGQISSLRRSLGLPPVMG